MISFDDADDRLERLNKEAYEEEKNFIVRMIDEPFHNIMAEVTRMWGPDSTSFFLQNAVSLLGRYRDTAVDEGDIVTLRDTDYVTGMSLIANIPTLLGEIIFPVLVYSCAYSHLFHTYFPQEEMDEGDGEFPDMEYAIFIEETVGISVQNRFYHVNQCLIQAALGNEEFGQQDLSSVRLTSCRVLGDEARET